MSARQALTTGSVIRETGIYRVIHRAHRIPHEVILFAGERFPRCAKCADEVVFELVHAAPEVRPDKSFRVVLNELPVLDEDDAAAAV